MTTGKTIALTRWTFIGKVMSLHFNKLSRLVTDFLPKGKRPKVGTPLLNLRQRKELSRDVLFVDFQNVYVCKWDGEVRTSHWFG